MICHWCNGTAAECGCGYGYCAHCNNGEITDPPFGPKPNSPELEQMLSDEDLKELGKIAQDSIINRLSAVSIYLAGDQLLSERELSSIWEYWDDDFRDETLGDVCRRVAWLVKQKIKKETT